MRYSRPTLSVVVPSFNQQRYLRQCLDSILAQRNAISVEVIVLDGGSSDGSAEIIRSYERDLAFWRSSPDRGQSAAIAEGFERASGELLVWMNSDDFFLPSAGASLADGLRKCPSADFFYGGISVVDAEGRRKQEKPTAGVNRWSFRYRGMIAYSMATFFRRELYDLAGPVNGKLRFVMDLDLFLRMIDHAKTCRLDRPHIIAAYREHAATKTSNILAVGIEEATYVRSLRGAWPTGGRLRRAAWKAGWVAANALRAAEMMRLGYGRIVFESLSRELRGLNPVSLVVPSRAREQ